MYKNNISLFLNSLDVFALMLNEHGEICFINDTVSSLLGFSYREVAGKKWTSLLSKPDRQDQENWFKQRNFSNHTSSFSPPKHFVQCLHKRGDLVPLTLTISETKINGETYLIGIGQDVSWALERESQLRELAEMDPLTHIDNRLGLDHFISDCFDTRLPFALFYMDLDNFKTVNDECGHTAGDDVLLECCERIKMQLRQDDEVARFGGDEFIAVCPKIYQNENAARIANSIRKAIVAPIEITGKQYYLDISIGIVVVDYNQHIDQRSLISLADKAMYKAKNGQTQVEFAETKTHQVHEQSQWH